MSEGLQSAKAQVKSDVKTAHLILPQKRIDWILGIVKNNSAARSRFKNCLRESAEHKVHQYLIGLGINVESELHRKAAILVLNASVCSANDPEIAGVHFAKALRSVLGDSSDLRFQKVMNSKTGVEFIESIGRLVRYVESKYNQPINYAQVWADALSFDENAERIKITWAKQFYNKMDLDVLEEDKSASVPQTEGAVEHA